MVPVIGMRVSVMVTGCRNCPHRKSRRIVHESVLTPFTHHCEYEPLSPINLGGEVPTTIPGFCPVAKSQIKKRRYERKKKEA